MKRGTIFLVFIILVLFSGCSKDTNQEAVKEAAYQIPEEDKLIVYTSHKEEVYAPIIKEFEERTGIFVEVKQGGTLELFDEIAGSEGEIPCDVMFGGGVENFAVYEQYLEPYRVKEEEMLEEQYCCVDYKWTPFSVLPIVFIYNNKLVYSEAAPKSWEELQTDRWNGKVAFADPSESGSSYTALCTMVQALGGDEDIVLKNFSEALDGHISEDSGAVLEEVDSGMRLVGITLEETAKKRIAQEADLSIAYPAEGTSAIPDGVAIIKGAAHTENAQKFLDFVVSEDVQRLLEEEMYRQSVRVDIETDSNQQEQNTIDQSMEKQNEANIMILIDYDIAWAAEQKEVILEKWAALQASKEQN